MLHKLRLTLSQIFEDACDNEIVYENPCKRVKAPVSQKVPQRVQPYTAEQMQVLLEYAKVQPLGLSVFPLLKCGLRRSELFGLRWQDIDFEKRRIHIRQAVTETKGILICDKPKSKTSARTLPMDSELKETLERVPCTVIRHKGKGRERVAVTIKNKYVISDIKGNAMRPTNWESRVYKRFMEAFHADHPDIPV